MCMTPTRHQGRDGASVGPNLCLQGNPTGLHLSPLFPRGRCNCSYRRLPVGRHQPAADRAGKQLPAIAPSPCNSRSRSCHGLRLGGNVCHGLCLPVLSAIQEHNSVASRISEPKLLSLCGGNSDENGSGYITTCFICRRPRDLLCDSGGDRCRTFYARSLPNRAEVPRTP